MKAMCQERDKSLLRKLSSLALLPPDMIENTFNDLKGDYICEDNTRFFSYIENYWIRNVSHYYDYLQFI
jgi:hypothetical protein